MEDNLQPNPRDGTPAGASSRRSGRLSRTCGMSILRRTGCLVLAMAAIANQLPAEDAPAPAAKPAEAAAVQPPAEAPAATPAATPAPGAASDGLLGLPIHGYLRTRYIGRTTSGAGDQDLYETLSLDIGDPAKNRVTAHFLGDVSMDLDGNTDTVGYHAFSSARDSTGSDVVPLVYSAYIDINRLGVLERIRVGRQSIYETPEVSFFDGLSAETAELGGSKVKFGAYGGVSVHLYQGYDLTDRINGAYASGRLWAGARARVDYQRLEGHAGDEKVRNTLWGVDGWQAIGSYVDLHAHYTRMDELDRDILVRGTFNQPVWDLRFQATYYQLLQAQQKNVAIEADSYYPVMKDYYPYWEVRGTLSKGFGEHVNVDAGADIRRLNNPAQASNFNHEFDRYFATLDLMDILVKGSSLSLTEEKWISDGTKTESQGLDLTCPIGKKTTASIGTAHYLYKYDIIADQERDDVQSSYIKIETKPNRAWRLSAEYDYEDDDSSGAYNELRCEATWTF